MASRPRIWPPILDWSGPGHWGPDEPCVLCGTPTPLRSDANKPCHKTCAEIWFEKHPEAWARFEAQRDGRGSALPPVTG